jgi:hypothetical protein
MVESEVSEFKIQKISKIFIHLWDFLESKKEDPETSSG